jgi:hypothetical protein
MREDEEGFGPGGKVTPLSSRDIPKPGSVLAQIEGYWQELRAASGGLPRRADLDASRIGAALPHAFILERAAGIGRIRIAGQTLTTLLGTEARGIPLSVLFTAGARPGLQVLLDRCFEAPALIDMGIAFVPGPIRAPVTGRVLLLPLLDLDGMVTRALGGLLIDGPARTGPMRFDLTDRAPRCEPVVVPAAPSRFAIASGPTANGFAEAERPYLRLVVSNA